MPKEITIKNLIFVDCERHGPAPALNDSATFEFGAVFYPSRQTYAPRARKCFCNAVGKAI